MKKKQRPIFLSFFSGCDILLTQDLTWFLRSFQSCKKILFMLSIFFLSFMPPLSAQQVREIDINADIILFDSDLGTDAKRLIGNVSFQHEDVFMTCDSAYFFSEENIVHAYRNVHLWQGDTLDLFGDYLKYDGDSKKADVRNNVILVDKESRLTTDYIDHDFENDLTYYLGGGLITSGDNTLESRRGFYYTEDKLFFFQDSVVIINPDYTIYADTLKYNTQTEVAYFLGPTDILSDDNFIYCENGWYDTQQNISQFNRNAYLESEDKILRGDSLYYERETGLGKAFINVELIDTTQDIILRGNEALYYEQSNYAMLTDSALMIQIQENDSLFVHADTLKSVPDTLEDHKIIKAYYHVKFFKSDLQGKCDSLSYADADSIFRFYGEPVIWSEDNQMTAEFIEVHTTNRQASKIEMVNTAFIVSREAAEIFNQIKGRNMTGYIKNNKLSGIEVNGNSQTIYYGKEEEEFIGVNKAVSSNLRLVFEDNKIERIIYLTSPEGTYYPVDKFPESESRLENFIWLEEYRPLSKYDVYRWE